MKSELSEAVEKLGITLTAKHIGTVFAEKKGFSYDEWRVTLSHQGKTLENSYMTGLGHRKESISNPYKGQKCSLEFLAKHNATVTVIPSIADVLFGLLMEAVSSTESFEDFCGNFGYDTDSRKALETYLTCQETHSKLIKFLGHETFNDLAPLEH
jgi:hypothetical protein